MAKYLLNVQLDADPSMHQIFSRAESFALNMVSDCIMQEMGKLEFGGIAKIQIHFTENHQQEKQQETLIDVVLVYKYLDIQDFLRRSSVEKRIMLAELVHDAMRAVACEHQVDAVILEPIRTKVVERLPNFKGWLTAEKFNASKECSARLYFNYGKSIEVGCHIRRPKGPDEKKDSDIILFYHAPILEPVIKMFSKLAWVDNSKVIVPRKGTADFWRIDVDEGTSEFVFDRAVSGQAHGLYDLGLMYLNGVLVLPDRKKAKHFLEEASRKGYKKADRILEAIAEIEN